MDPDLPHERFLPIPWKSRRSMLPVPEDSLNELMAAEIQRMGLALKHLDAQTRAAEEVEGEMASVIAELVAASKPTKPLRATPTEHYDLALHLVEFPRTPLYVKRRFDVSFKLVGEESAQCGIYPLQCTLCVRRMDSEGAEIVKSRAGKAHIGTAYLRGPLTQSFPQVPVMTFRRLVFSDISSVFPLGRVNLFIQCPDNPRVKQLLIEGVRVKARKKRPDEVL